MLEYMQVKIKMLLCVVQFSLVVTSVTDYKPTGDQPGAIDYLVKGINEGKKFQTLLGVTGSGKTFTMANIINKVQKPTLVLAHNKTLARPVIF